MHLRSCQSTQFWRKCGLYKVKERETAPVVTDVANTDSSIVKKQTTVGLDFGLLTLDNGDRIRLFGTPGQGRFSFLWSILAVNAIDMIILIDNSRPDPRADLKMYLDAFAKYLANIRRS